jgi:hypothetical protein
MTKGSGWHGGTSRAERRWYDQLAVAAAAATATSSSLTQATPGTGHVPIG